MSQDRVMLLIDADNVSIDIMEQAVQLLHKQHGGVHVRRAYCTAESAMKHQAAFKRLGIKPMVNLAAGKNSTDIALAVDAIDLVLAERPDVVVIASSDSDFAPLVQRLREKGCEVRGIGQLGKTGQETQDVYDDYTVLEHRKSTETTPARSPARKAAGRTAAAKKAPAAKKLPAAKKTTARKTAAKTATVGVVTKTLPPARATAVSPAPAPGPAAAAAPGHAEVAAAAPDATVAPKPARKSPAAKSAARKSAARKTAPAALDPDTANTTASAVRAAPLPVRAATPATAEPTARNKGHQQGQNPGQNPGQTRASIDAVLACLPELQSGKSLALNTAVRRLRDAQLLGQNSSSLKLFSAWPERFELVPADRPSVVRLRGN